MPSTSDNIGTSPVEPCTEYSQEAFNNDVKILVGITGKDVSNDRDNMQQDASSISSDRNTPLSDIKQEEDVTTTPIVAITEGVPNETPLVDEGGFNNANADQGVSSKTTENDTKDQVPGDLEDSDHENAENDVFDRPQSLELDVPATNKEKGILLDISNQNSFSENLDKDPQIVAVIPVETEIPSPENKTEEHKEDTEASKESQFGSNVGQSLLGADTMGSSPSLTPVE